MKLEDLKEEIFIELENIDAVVKEVIALRNDLGPREPTVREKTAGAAFLADFYNGIATVDDVWVKLKASLHDFIEKLDSHSIRPRRLTAEAISDIAGTYLFEKVGDAVAAEKPVWDGEKWRIQVTLPSLQKELGKLTFSADGQLVTAESDSPVVLEEKANEK